VGMRTSSEDEHWFEVLEHYELGQIINMRAGSGTAAPKRLVETSRGTYLVRQRRPISSPDEIVAFDHSVIEAVARAGLPVVEPERAREGKTWVRVAGQAYEVFPFVSGLERFRQGSMPQVSAAAKCLAQFHQATRQASLRGRKNWQREHQISVMTATLREALEQHTGHSEQVRTAAQMLQSAVSLRQVLREEFISSLVHVVIHGDYTPANVGFHGENVGGIFDFDWVSRQARVIDVGEALLFFAFRRRNDIDPGSIWSLVQSWEPDVGMAETFLTAYQTVAPLTAEECQALPLFMRETWLGVRIRAMRKVRPEERLAILTEGAMEPLTWLEDNTVLISQLASDTRPNT